MIGAVAAVGGQIINQWRIQVRHDRDKLRSAYVEYAETAVRFVQRAEIAVLYRSQEVGLPTGAPLPQEYVQKRLELILDAGAALDQYSTAFCKVMMLRHGRSDLDDGEALYRQLMKIPSEITNEPGKTADDLTSLCDRHRQEIRDWLVVQSRRFARPRLR